MLVPQKQLPREIIAFWPEVFEEVSLNVIPLHYIRSIVISFKDADSWEINISTKARRDSLEDQLAELLSSYQDSIDEINVKLDPNKIKKDIEKLTTKFLKKNKL